MAIVKVKVTSPDVDQIPAALIKAGVQNNTLRDPESYLFYLE